MIYEVSKSSDGKWVKNGKLLPIFYVERSALGDKRLLSIVLGPWAVVFGWMVR